MGKDNLGTYAKERLVLLAKEMDRRLEVYWDGELKRNFGFNISQKELVKKILLHAKEHNLRSAKRARAGFVYYGYKLGEKDSGLPQLEYEIRNDGGDIWKACEAVEIVHTALLMHDDFMDEDLVRRGEPTTQVFFGKDNKHFGEAMAVNVGDAVLCLGYERLLDCGFEAEKINKVMRQMLRSITNTAYGQAYDVSLPKLEGLNEEKVLSLHRAKTGIYTYENPLLIGGILAGLGEDILETLRDYSADGGVAFQLQDDILGMFGDENKTGKSANSDLLQGKVTLLVVKTLEMGNEEQKKDLLKVWGKGGAVNGSLVVDGRDIERAKRVIKESGSYEYSVEVARKLNLKSIETIQKLREMNLKEESIDYLEGIARYMMEREV